MKMTHKACCIMFVGLSVASPALAETAEISPLRSETCDPGPALSCANNYLSDLQVEDVPLNLDSGIWYPRLGGIFATMERRRRAREGLEPKMLSYPKRETDDLIESDPATVFRIYSASPTAENLIRATVLLSEEVLVMEPTEAPLRYLYLTKMLESTLFVAADEDNARVYAMAENARNCIQLSLIEQRTDRLTETCLPAMRSMLDTMQATPE